jgi:hypothetical protein
MSFDALTQEIESLASDERRRLLAFLVALEDRSRPDYGQELARRIDDRAPERWLTIEQAEQALGLAAGDEKP